MKKIVITGASGLVGKELSIFLSKRSYDIAQLSRTKNGSGFNSFIWNVDQKLMDIGALQNADYVVHLAGAGIADKRWSKKRKINILNSRVESTKLLFDEISKLTVKPKAVISASAIGYYGAITTDQIFEENDPPANDFMGTVCSQWESAVQKFNILGIRAVQLRFGVILSSKGGALEKMLLPYKFGLGSALGSGNQYIPWVHIIDVINIISKSITDNSMSGVFNVVSPNSSSNHEFSKTVADVLQKPYFMPNVPSFILKLALGEMSNIILEGSRVSSKKVIDSGYTFQFPELKEALNDLLIK